jgi:hypothetical protein
MSLFHGRQVKYVLAAVIGVLINIPAAAQIAKPHQISPQAFQRQTLAQAAPFIDLHLDQQRYHLWLLSADALWQWNFVSQTLKRYRLNANQITSQLGFEGIWSTPGRDGFWVAAGYRLYQIETDPFRVHEYRSPEAHGVQTLGISALDSGQCCFWFRSDGWYIIDPEREQVQFESRLPATQQPKRKAFYWQGHLWSLTANRLYRWDLKSGDQREVYHSEDPLLKYELGADQDLILVSRSALLRFNGNGRLLQILPSRSRSVLRHVRLGAKEHRYFFANGLLELYDRQAQRKTTSLVSRQTNVTFGLTVSQGPFLATLRDHSPSIFIIGEP